MEHISDSSRVGWHGRRRADALSDRPAGIETLIYL